MGKLNPNTFSNLENVPLYKITHSVYALLKKTFSLVHSYSK